jgi:drug/metabolite transporter (DMT)-like permease
MIITVVSLYFLMKKRGEIEKVSRAKKIQLFGIGGLIAMHWVCFYGSIKYSNVSIALTCLSSAGLFTSILEPLMTSKKIQIREVLLGLIGIVGIYLIFHFDPQYKTGIIVGIISTVLSCVFSVFNKKQVADTAPKTMMLYELGGGLIILTLVMPLYLWIFPTQHTTPNINDLIWLLLLSWFCTILAMDLSLQALKKVTAFTQNLTLNLEPVYGIILAFIVYKENKYLSDGFYFGFGLILLAVVLQMLRIVRSTRKEIKLVGD